VFGPSPTTDGGPFHLAGVPLVNFLTAPFYLFDAIDTLDKIHRPSLVPVTPAPTIKAALRCRARPVLRRQNPARCIQTFHSPLTRSNRAKPASFLSIGCRGHPCPRKCETHGGFHIQFSDFPFPNARALRARARGLLIPARRANGRSLASITRRI